MSDAVMVPRAWLEAFRRDTDPTEPIADNGGTVWDMFCHEAERYAASTPVGGWEDISTAPKDETRVLIFRPSDFEEDRVFHAQQDAEGYWFIHDGKHDHSLRGDQPTHWMPLPPPPSVSIDNGSRPQEAVPTEGHGAAVVALTRKTASALPVGTALEVIDADSFLRRNGFPNGSRVTLRGFDGFYIDIGEMPCPQGTCPERFALSTPQPADGCSSNEGVGGWIEWSGGENPVPGKVAETRHRDGTEYTGAEAWNSDWWHGEGFWVHDGTSSDIIAYRILPQTEKGS